MSVLEGVTRLEEVSHLEGVSSQKEVSLLEGVTYLEAVYCLEDPEHRGPSLVLTALA